MEGIIQLKKHNRIKIMRDLHNYLSNPFEHQHISMDELVAFATDHLARTIANNPAGIFDLRIAATTTALNGVGGVFHGRQNQAGAAQIQKANEGRLPPGAAGGHRQNLRRGPREIGDGGGR